MARKAVSSKDKDAKYPSWCWSCKVNLAERKPTGIYCMACRLDMASGKKKSVLK